MRIFKTTDNDNLTKLHSAPEFSDLDIIIDHDSDFERTMGLYINQFFRVSGSRVLTFEPSKKGNGLVCIKKEYLSPEEGVFTAFGMDDEYKYAFGSTWESDSVGLRLYRLFPALEPKCLEAEELDSSEGMESVRSRLHMYDGVISIPGVMTWEGVCYEPYFGKGIACATRRGNYDIVLTDKAVFVCNLRDPEHLHVYPITLD